jgi:hypothetical protein
MHFLTGWIKQLGPCNINRSVESTNEIMKFIDNIQQDNAIVVITNLNHEVICIILFCFVLFCFEIKHRSFICNITYNICFFVN